MSLKRLVIDEEEAERKMKDAEAWLGKQRALRASKHASKPFNPDLRVDHCRRFSEGNPMEGIMMANKRVW